VPFEGVVGDVDQHFHLGPSCRAVAGDQSALVELFATGTESADVGERTASVVGVEDSEDESARVAVHVQNGQGEFVHPLVQQGVLAILAVPGVGVVGFLEGAVGEVSLSVQPVVGVQVGPVELGVRKLLGLFGQAAQALDLGLQGAGHALVLPDLHLVLENEEGGVAVVGQFLLGPGERVAVDFDEDRVGSLILG